MSRLVALVAALLVLLVVADGARAQGRLEAGVATVDTTYHVGSSAGQYASTRDGGAGDFDPHVQQGKNQASYGIQSRLTARAIVVREAGGQKHAILKTDLYIPQDLLWRRVAHLLEQGDSGIGRKNLTMSVSHNHSSPYYSSTAWGAWAFQDVFDIRFYETMARRFADAVEQADAKTVPVRVSARTGTFDKLHRNSMGPSTADDGTPAGYPQSDSEHTFTVVRFDDVTAKKPKPLAVFLNYSGHPEFLNGNNLLSADYLGPLERFVDRETGATTVFTQNAVGTAEPENSTFNDFTKRLEFSHRQYGQAELGARMLADAVVDTWRAIGEQDAGDQQLVPWMTTAPVQVSDRWFPGPLSHPYPTVSNCRTEPTVEGSVGVPVIGLPDCTRDVDASGVLPDSPYSPGLPLPSNYSFPSYGSLQESLGIHLQALRIGEVLFTFCSCEQWKDQSRNIQTRTDKTPGNEWLGYDWSDRCAPANSIECRRMRAQVNNDAAGWNDPEYVLQAESEPDDPEQIKGNYTHDDTPENAKYGYALTVPVSMANDYNGYIATYREYQRGDHYRKALTAFGPHSSDYLATRLANMGRALRGSQDAKSELENELLNSKQVADQAHADAKATALGAAAQTALATYEQSLPDDGGSPAVLTQPSDVERFAAAQVRWRGGDNYVDDPRVVVERKQGKRWVLTGDQSGEVVTTVKFPAPEDAFSRLTGNQEWEWTATWETFVGRAPSREVTPPGTYRFVVAGSRRSGRQTVPYKLTSSTFTVRPWDGITVDGALEGGRPVFRLGPGGMRDGVTLKERRDNAPIPVRGPVGPIDYPDSYGGELKPRFIDDQRTVVRDPSAPDDASKWEWYCLDCSFRPWLDAGDAERVVVTVTGADGTRRRVAAERTSPGVWALPAPLAAGESARVERGDALDAYGNHNGLPSNVTPP